MDEIRESWYSSENMYFQHRGIEMGNSASVSIANLTLYYEIIHLFEGNENIAMYKRFLDDLFLLVCMDDIENIVTWLDSLLNHRYLKFTYEYNKKSISFLDVNVNLSEKNVVGTSLFRKPMNKHVYLRAESDHPVHLKNSLFYSQGLRMVRICSDLSSRHSHLLSLYKKFTARGYDDKVLYPIFIKLCSYSRMKALEPKKRLLKSYLNIHNPEIMKRYTSLTVNSQVQVNSRQNLTYIVFPFYSCIPHYAKKIVKCIRTHSQSHCTNQSYKDIVEDLGIKVVHSRTHNLKEELR